MTGCSTPGFYEDYRLGGVRRLTYCRRPEELMRVSDELLECVCFLCTEPGDGSFTLRGTAFFVSIPSERIPGGSFSYLITARHNIIKASAVGLPLILRVNLVNGGAELIEITNLRWFFPDNDAADVAVSGPIGGFEEIGLKYRRIPRVMFATPEVIEAKSIGVGDELIVTGLFVHHYGRQRNVPIIRSGNIAAMPTEPLIDNNSGLEYRAFLAEIRSIGGLSGSPVFVRLGVGRQVEENVTMNRIETFLLGLVRGHWPHGDFDTADFADSEQDELNSGIAIVTSITDALEVLDREDFVKQRKEKEAEYLQKHAPVEDSASVDVSQSEFERFEDLTRKLVNTPKPATEKDES
jgi:hypothetical protein